MSQGINQSSSYRAVKEQRIVTSSRGTIQSQRVASEAWDSNQDANLQGQLVYRSMKFPTDMGFDELVQKREVLTDLLRDFDTRDGRVVIDGQKKEDYSKRLHLLENQIEGLMRQNFFYEKTNEKGTRVLDYAALINEKENQVVELEKKITNIEGHFRMKDQRIRELEAEIEKLHGIILSKNKIIEQLENSGKYYSDSSSSDRATNELKNLIKKLQSLEQRGCSMQQLDGAVESWILTLPEESSLKEKLKIAELRYATEDKYRTSMMRKLSEISNIYKSQIDQIKTNSRVNVDYDPRITNPLGLSVGGAHGTQSKDGMWALLSGANGKTTSTGSMNYDLMSDMWNTYSRDWSHVRTVQVPVQDARTKALIHKLAKELNRLTIKYPALNKEISSELSEFFSQEIIDLIEVDELDRLVSIVKYEPHVVKVDNVYSYSSEKSRKVEFHLRVLIKTLLEEMEKMKAKTGVEPEIDSGVIGMIRQEIMDVVNVDDILMVFRAPPKIVEVEKVVQKIVERIVQVPRMVAVETSTAVPVETRRVDVVENVRNVPVEVHLPVPIIEQKIVRVPEYVEKVIEVSRIENHHMESVREVPKARTIEQIVPRDREVERIVEVPGPEKIVEVPKIEIKNMVMDKIVEVLRTEEIIKTVDRIIEKPVEVIKEVPKMVVVQKIVEKIITVKEYINNDVHRPYVVDRPYPVEVIVEKIVPVERIVERILEVPQVVEKIVTVRETVEIIKPVDIIREIPIMQKEIQVVQRYIEVPVQKTVEVEKAFDRIVEVPIVHENVRVETEYIKEPVLEKVERIIHQEVPVQQPVIMYEDKVVEVQKMMHTIAIEQEPVILYQDKIVPMETVREQLIPTPYIIEKIIEKLVEVPRVVEIQRIVEKIVPVPRIVEKIVQVEKIVEKIVKEVVFQDRIVEVERRVEVPCIIEKIIEVEVPRNIYSRVEVPKEVIREIMVRDTETIERPSVQIIEQPPRIVIERREVDVPMIVEKIVSVRTYDNKYVELKEQIIVPVEIQIPRQIIVEKLVPVEHVRPIVQEVDRVVEKIIQVNVENTPEVVTVDCVREILRVEKDKEFIEVPVPQPVDRVVEVERLVQKIIPPVTVEVERIKEVPYMVEKIIDRLVHIPRVYEVEKRMDVPVDRPYIYQVDRIIPQIVTLNQSIEKIVDRIVEVPTLLEKINRVEKLSERNVPVNSHNTHVETVERNIEKEVLIERLRDVQSIVNHVSQVMQVVERMVEKPMEPVLIYNQKIMEVPVVIEKIAEKIIIMPQIVEVLKYVHEMSEQKSLGIALEGQVGIEEAEYQRLGKNLNSELSRLRVMISGMRQGQGSELKSQLATIDSFLSEFNKFIMYPRIREIISEKVVQNVVEKDRVVRVPVSTIEDEKRNLASAVLIDKLIIELRRLKKANPNIKFDLDQDIMEIFGSQLNPISGEYGNNYNKLLDEYSRAIHTRFSSAGNWNTDQQLMLREFINDRFELAYLSKKNENDAKQYRARYESAVNSSRKYKDHIEDIQKRFTAFDEIFPVIIEEGLMQGRLTKNSKKVYEETLSDINRAVFGYAMGAQTKPLEKIEYERVSKVIREKEEEIIRLKERIAELLRTRTTTESREVRYLERDADHSSCNQRIRGLEEELRRLRYVEEAHRGCEDRLRILTIVEREHSGCKHRIDELLAQIERLKREMDSYTSPKSRVTKVTESRNIHGAESRDENYGTHFEEYTNLNDVEESSDDQYASRHNLKGYGSTGANGGGSGGYSGQQYSTQYMTASRGSSGDIGVDSRGGQTYKSSFQRVEYSGSARQSSQHTIEYSHGGGSNIRLEESFKGGALEGSENGSNMYEQSSRDIIRRNYREEDLGGSTGSKRFSRDNWRERPSE